MSNKPAPVTDALERRLRNEVSIHVSLSGEDELSRDILALLDDRTRYREVLRLWDDHLPGCSGSPRCECGYAEARALLEVPDAK